MTRPESKERSSRPPGLPIRVATVAAAIAAPIAFGSFLFRAAMGGDGEVSHAGIGVRRPSLPVHERKTEPGQTLSDLLGHGGLSGREVALLRDLARPYVDRGGLGPTARARFHGWPDAPPERVEVVVDRDRTLVFQIHGAAWAVAVESVTVRLDTVVVSGRVDDTGLWAARLGGEHERLDAEGRGALAGHLADVFAWQVDFFRDVRPGDAFRIAVEREIRPDGTARAERPLAADWWGTAGRLRAYRFAADPDRPLYYDAGGTNLKGPFLRAPLDLVRVTSRFSSDRYHPALGRSRPHRGVDYGAAPGTPVRVTGDGTVRTAGWAGDYGLLIEVDHADGIRTRYAHLSGVAPGLVPGTRVTQGERIGSVGATGLATGPHLHYELLIGGRPVDPSSIDLPVERPLPSEALDRFRETRRSADRLIARIGAPPLASGLETP
ncbi:MAG: M23 family metallopeptidase [Gemmatimonadetes bacterium]|nr:M23 family metallopeptidase [Gemmatimonadota bacterium]